MTAPPTSSSSLPTARAPPNASFGSSGRRSASIADNGFCISINGPIGPDERVSLAMIKDHLACASAQRVERIHLHVDSGGGNIHEALAIFSALRAYPRHRHGFR